MAMMIDQDCISEIQLSDGKWYPIKPGSFGIDNLYFQENESRGENRYMNGQMFFDHIEIPERSRAEIQALEVIGFVAEERGRDTMIYGHLSSIQNYRTIHRSKLSAEVKARRKQQNWRNDGFSDDK